MKIYGKYEKTKKLKDIGMGTVFKLDSARETFARMKRGLLNDPDDAEQPHEGMCLCASLEDGYISEWPEETEVVVYSNAAIILGGI